MTDDNRPPRSRSPSQASSSSRHSSRAKTLRAKPSSQAQQPQLSKRHSAASNASGTDLTSFPSLSPDRSPEGFSGQPALNRALTNTLLEDTPDPTTSTDRKATLATLTNSSPHAPGRTALFEDSVSAADVPGALHLADDAHIERLIANTGAVKLVRQFARDLAQRDAEISALRHRADARERELKRMLRELSVSSRDIERRLDTVDNSPASTPGKEDGTEGKGINGLMSQAMADAVGDADEDPSTIRGKRVESDSKSASSVDSNTVRQHTGSVRGWQDYLFGSSVASRKTSRGSSVVSDLGDDEGTERRVPSNPSRRKPLDGQLFQPADGNAGKKTEPDDSSIRSHKSSRSLSSWTVKLFAGNAQAKDGSVNGRGRAPSAEQDRKGKTTAQGNSAVAALKRINGNGSGRSNGSSGTGTPSGRKPAASVSQGTGETDKSSTNLGPVEMDAILPPESRPPTLTHTYNNYQPDLLTDRFGFIYDQRRKKRQREATAFRSGRVSIAETLNSYRSDASDDDHDQDSLGRPGSHEDPESTLRKWQDYLRFPTKPTELLSHTPSAAPIISMTENRPRSASAAVDKAAVSLNPNAQPSASTSTVVAEPEFSGSDEPVAVVNESEPVKLLLEQLTDLHDSLQRDRTVRWNEFLRKVRAERRKEGEAAAAAAAASDRPMQSVDMPEASLADGEVIGIAGLGNKGKVGRAKWREFRSLVLGGIPVALRAKVWSECSGASAMRVPGYYDDLVKGVGGTEPDSSVVAQIDMDIHRTLTDNVFFRKGPGVAKLKEVLLAYSRRNPEVGYCQGMNLIAASLLLIMPTAEDAFWILGSMIEVILPQHYYDHGLLASRADQVILRQYISHVLPRLSAHLDSLGIELEALTFQWFLSVFTDCLSAEALYRVWDVVLCLNVTSTVTTGTNTPTDPSNRPPSPNDTAGGGGGGSTFLFQVALALLKLNEQQLLTACSTPAALYTYINHQMTNHAISIDGLIQASEALRNVVRREDVVTRRARAVGEMTGG